MSKSARISNKSFKVGGEFTPFQEVSKRCSMELMSGLLGQQTEYNVRLLEPDGIQPESVTGELSCHLEDTKRN